MKGITKKTDKEMDKLKARANKVGKALEMMIPKKKLDKKVNELLLNIVIHTQVHVCMMTQNFTGHACMILIDVYIIFA